MKLRVAEVRDLLETLFLEALGDDPPPGCNVRFKRGESLPLVRPVRVIPHEGAYMGGETTGARGRGTTAATLPPGTMCKVLQLIGSGQAWLEVAELDKPIRIHINKFCQTQAELYAASKMKKREAPPLSGRMQAPQAQKSPEEELQVAQQAVEQARQAYILAKKRLAAAEAMMSPDEGLDDLG